MNHRTAEHFTRLWTAKKVPQLVLSPALGSKYYPYSRLNLKEIFLHFRKAISETAAIEGTNFAVGTEVKECGFLRFHGR